MAELVPSGCIVGHTTKDAAAATGLPVGLPLVAVGGDGQAAGVGAGIVAPGRAYLNLGTAIVSGVLRQDYLYDQAFRTLFDASGRGYFLETDLHGGTFTLNWLRSTLLGDERGDLTRLEHESRSLAPGADGLLMLPYQGGVMNPYWDASASASFMGLRAHHRPCHFYRAIIEGIALEQRLQSAAVANVAGAIEEFVVLGGGSSSDLWCQVLADVLQKPVVRAASREATALGAAVVAMARGSDCSERAVAMTALAERFEPGPHATYYDALYREVYQGWYPSLRERMGRLDALSKGAR
jgi:xylulokinase